MTGNLNGELALVVWIFELYKYTISCRNKVESDALIEEMDRLKKMQKRPKYVKQVKCESWLLLEKRFFLNQTH